MNVLVTGCSSGFGELTAKTLARAGHRVFATIRDSANRNREASEALRAWATDHGADVQVVELDLGDPTSIEACVDGVLHEAGALDVVINNAAVAASGPLEAFDLQQVRSLYQTNLFGPLQLAQAVLPHMRQRRSGLLVFVSSTLGRVLPRSGGLYPASKWAVEGIAESLRYEVARFDIDVAILEPGRFPTPAVSRGMRPGRADVVTDYEAARGERPGVGPDDHPPDPQMVADALLRLVELPAGQRPLRTVVGTVFTDGVAEYNAEYERVRDRLREALDRRD